MLFLLRKRLGHDQAVCTWPMVLAACPTGHLQPIQGHLARGDVALALSFTAVASVATIFHLPLVVTWGAGPLPGRGLAVDVPVA